MKHFLMSLMIFSSMFAAPPKDIPPELRSAYTLNDQIPVSYWYFDGTYSPNKPRIFTIQDVNKFIYRAKKRLKHYYGKTDKYLYQAIERYVGNFEGKTVGILGTVIPWYEAIILVYGGQPITVEYNKVLSKHPGIRTMTVEEYKKNPIKFDYLLSVSSIEHDGLGRYGDPLNPFADIETMHSCKDMLNEGGLFFLAIPVGRDLVVWNAHRIYGKIRLPMLLQGWDLVDSVGFSQDDFTRDFNDWRHQPVFVLAPGTKED